MKAASIVAQEIEHNKVELPPEPFTEQVNTVSGYYQSNYILFQSSLCLVVGLQRKDVVEIQTRHDLMYRLT
ncbi:hypothetical protein [Pseudoalteromonas byunsanensis]|uniref:Uncharacterized protein n=1 Tax=Pseudoalteromonas byunsanensis TaxID=327939 RepID=A0A1S1N1K3_9GAMM|nr:hypothetical protein BIW53_13070 [Pseudoalteromonas byunsanensis]